jgi:hypothetical protein
LRSALHSALRSALRSVSHSASHSASHFTSHSALNLLKPLLLTTLTIITITPPTPGLYLCQIENEEEETHLFTAVEDPATEGTLFSINELNSTSKYLSNAKALQLGNNGTWIERGEMLNDGEYIVKGTKEKSNALNLILHRFLRSSTTDESEKTDKEAESASDAKVLLENGLFPIIFLRAIARNRCNSAFDCCNACHSFMHLLRLPYCNYPHNELKSN